MFNKTTKYLLLYSNGERQKDRGKRVKDRGERQRDRNTERQGDRATERQRNKDTHITHKNPEQTAGQPIQQSITKKGNCYSQLQNALKLVLQQK